MGKEEGRVGGQRGRAVCTVTIICVYENLWTIVELEEKQQATQGPRCLHLLPWLCSLEKKERI